MSVWPHDFAVEQTRGKTPAGALSLARGCPPRRYGRTDNPRRGIAERSRGRRGLQGPRVQDVDCVADIEAFPQPAGPRCLRVEMKARGFV